MHDESIPALHFCGDFVVRRNWKLGPRTLDEHELVYFPQATTTTYKRGNQIYTLQQPCWIITRAGDEHSYHFGETAPTRHLFLHFSGGEALFPALLGKQGPDLIPMIDGGFHSTLLRHMMEIAHTFKDAVRCSMLLTTLLGELNHTHAIGKNKPDLACPKQKNGAAAGPAYPLVVSKALSYIRRRLAEPITVTEIAAHCQMSHEHLTRVFVRSIGMPIRQMIIQLRLERAAHMLCHSTLSIKEIASQCGYNENHYFSRAFTAHFGITATDYRNQYADPRVQHIVPDERLEEGYPINVYFEFTP